MGNEQEVKPGQRWMPKTPTMTFQEGRVIASVEAGRYTATDHGGGPLEFLRDNFTLCHCAALHDGPCQSPKIAPPRAPACQPWCGCYGSHDWHFCSDACARKAKKPTLPGQKIDWIPISAGVSIPARADSRTESDVAGVMARAHIPSTQAGCLLGCKCPIHRPPREPYVPTIDEFDLLPDA